MNEDLGICQQVRKLREGALPFWRPLYDARTRERAFLDGERFISNKTYATDRREMQFRGQETTSVGRNKAAQSTADPRNLEALPVDRYTDANDAEIGVSILEWELNHPQKGFDDTLEEVVQDAIDARAGCAMLHFDPDQGAFGETYWQWTDANLVMFEEGFADPHHVACGWMQHVRRMKLDEVRAMGKLKGKAKWYVPADLRPDGQLEQKNAALVGADGIRFDADALLGVPGAPVDDEHIWVLFCWYKNDPSTYKRQSDEREIPEGERYMGCDNEACAYRSDSQDELIARGKLEQGESLPDEMEPCPECGGHLSRRDIRAVEEDVLTYPKGRRLVVLPLLQQLPEDEPFYDGGWPVPTARSFPMLWITAYARAGRPMGDSDTFRNWDPQIFSDQLMTMAFDRITRHQNYYWTPDQGNSDYTGARFEFRDDQFNVIFADWSDPAHPPVEPAIIKGASLDEAWSSYWDRVQQVLLGAQGTNDMGLTPDSSKNIAAATVEQLDRIGNIPVAHFKRRMNRALGKAYGVHWDYLRGTYTRKRLARLKIGDEFVVDRLRGDELPNFDFVISESPPFTGLDKTRAEAFTALIQVATQTPHLVEAFAEMNKFPPSVVRKIKRAMALKEEADRRAARPVPDEMELPGGMPGQDNPLAMLMRGAGAQPNEAGAEMAAA